MEANGKSLNYHEKKGLVTFQLDAGWHAITITYTGTFLQKFSVWLSVFSLFVVLLVTFAKKRRTKKKQ